MYEQFEKREPFALLDTSKYPPEVAGRFNSFITTQFDDSLSVEMQMRSIIKWAIDNFKDMDQTYNDFTEYVVQGNLNPFIEFLNDLIEYMNDFIDTFDTKFQEEILKNLQEWYNDGTLETLINETLETKYHEMDNRLTSQLTQKANEEEVYLKANQININDFDEPTRQTFLETQGIDVNYVLGEKNVKPINTTFFKTGKNLFDKNTVILDKVLLASTGEEETSENSTISDYILVNAETDYTITRGFGSGGYGHCFYDSNKNFISGVISNVTGTQTVTSPTNARFLRVSTGIDYLDIQQVEEGLSATSYEPYKQFVDLKYVPEITINPSNTTFFKVGKNKFDKNTVILEKALLVSTGEEATSTGNAISDYIRVKPNTNYTITRGLGSSGYGHCFYGSNKNFISGVVSTSTVPQTVKTPTNASFLRVSTDIDYLDTQQVEEGSYGTKYEPFGQFIGSNYIPKTPIEPSDTTFFKIGKNKFNKNTVLVGHYVNQLTGATQAGASHVVSDYIEVKPSTSYIGSQLLQRYVFYDSNRTYISGATGLTGLAITSPSNAKYLRVSSDNWNLDTLQIEEGTVSTNFEEWKHVIPSNYLKEVPSIEVPPFIGDGGKNYRIVGANIRTPISTGGSFALHNDEGHEPMGIASLAIVDGDLRVIMNFTSKKVVTMNVNPHVSMRNQGYEVATTGGLNIHAVSFYKDGVKVNAEDVVINGGSFWFSGVFLV